MNQNLAYVLSAIAFALTFIVVALTLRMLKVRWQAKILVQETETVLRDGTR